MFGIVALCCLYLGIKNVKSAFSLAPFSRWQFINWAPFLTGVLMLLLIIPCLMQADKDLKKAQKEKDDKEKAERKNKKITYLYDKEDGFTAADKENSD